MDYKKKLIDGIASRRTQLDMEKILRAYDIAREVHGEQMRQSGEPYISHPVEVALILVGMDCDTDTVVAALLHDTLEDTDLSPATIRKEFGADVLLIVDGLSKLSKINYNTEEDEQAENLRKMLLAMVQDIRVILIKLADRLHNMRTLSFKTEAKQREISFETMQIFAPLADRLGMRRIKAELQDISLSYLDPIGYAEIERDISAIYDHGDQMLRAVKEKMSARFGEANIKFSIDSRIKQIYSVYNKMYTQNHTFDEIYDLFAVRVIVDSVPDCYNVLGMIHDMFTPLPGRFKDTFRRPSRTCTNPCTRSFSLVRGYRLRCRSAHGRCIGWPSLVLRRIGNTKAGLPAVIRSTANWSGSVRF